MSIDTIASLGDDALQNLFEIVIPTFPGAIDVQSTMLRITKLSVPEYSINTYTIDYKTQKMTKPAAKISTPNSFTFSFRVDKYWDVYEGIETWINTIANHETGSMAADGLLGVASAIRVPIDIIPVDANGEITKTGWTFQGCFPSGLSGISFDQSSTEPFEAQVTMQYIKRVLRT